MTSARKTPNLRLAFSVIEGCYYILVFFTEGLFSSYLSDFGYAQSFIGLSFMTTGIAAIIINPIVGYLVDKFNNCRLVLLVLTGFSVGLTPFFFAFCTNKVMILVYAAIAMSFTKSCMGVTDAWISKISREIPGVFDYGKIRSIGSITYALGAVVFGKLLSLFGNSYASFFMIGAWLIMAMCVFIAPNPKMMVKTENVRLRFAVKELFSNKYYLVYLFCMLFTSLTSQSAFTFYPLLLRELGGDVSHVGLGYFILASSEFFVVLYFSKIAKKLGTARALGIGMIGYGIKNFVFSLSPSLPFGLAASALQAISFAFVIPGAVMFINENISHTYIASALVLHQAVQNFSQITSSPMIGAISERYSVKTMMALFSIPAFIGGGIFLVVNRMRLNREKKAAAMAGAGIEGDVILSIEGKNS